MRNRLAYSLPTLVGSPAAGRQQPLAAHMFLLCLILVPAKKAEDKDDFTIMLVSAGDKKINVIKEVRAATSLGLKEAKDLVEGAPKEVKTGVPKKEADEIKAKLEAAGAKVELK